MSLNGRSWCTQPAKKVSCDLGLHIVCTGYFWSHTAEKLGNGSYGQDKMRAKVGGELKGAPESVWGLPWK